MGVTDSPVTKPCELIDVSPELVEQWVSAGDAILIDVREDFEHASERIEHAHHHPLSKFDSNALQKKCDGKRIVFHCRTGSRSLEAALQLGSARAFHLQGGIEAWKASGRPVHRSASAPRLDVMRQVQVVAGILILLGVVLGAFVNPWLYGISAFVGCGLLFAGLSGWCGMAMLLARMPWNQSAASCSKASCSESEQQDLANDF